MIKVLILLSAGLASDPSVMDMLMSPHAVPLDVVLSDAQYTELLSLARNPKTPFYARVRAIGLAGLRHDPGAEKLWAEARTWDDPELRIQAAYAQALARSRDPVAFAAFVRALLADKDKDLQDVGRVVSGQWRRGERGGALK